MFRLCAILFFLFFAGGALAQTSGPDDTTKLKKKTIKVSVMDPKGKKRVQYNGEPIIMDSVQKAVKLDPILLVRGEFSVFYEWRLNHRFSLEGGAGITYLDIFYETFENDGRFLPDAEENKDVQFQTGFAFRFQPRYYPSRYETAITGFYIAPMYAYRTWNMKYFINNGLVAMPNDVHRAWHEIRFQFGEQDCEPYSVPFTEWYINIGAQLREDDRVIGRGVTAEIGHVSEVRLMLGAGIKFGFVL